MKNSIIVVVLLTLLVGACTKKNDAPPTNENKFVKLFGGIEKEAAHRIVLLPDGGVAGVGYTESFPIDNKKSNFFFFVMDGVGNIVTQKGVKGTTGHDILLLQDGNFLLAGESEPINLNGDFGSDAYMVKVDRNGQILDTVRYRPSETLIDADWNVRGLSIRPSDNGGYWLAGVAFTGDDETKDTPSKLFVTKFKSDFKTVERERVYGFEGVSNRISSISITPAGDVAVIGTVKNVLGAGVNTTNPSDVRVTLTDEWANLKWDLGINTKKNDVGVDMQKIPEGFVSVATIFDEGDKDVLAQRLDNFGNVVASIPIAMAENQIAKSIAPTRDGGCIVLADTENRGSGNKLQTDLLLIKIDNTGKIEWTKNFGSPENDSGGVVKETDNGDFVIFGTFGFVTSQMCGIIRVNSKGDFLN